MSETNYDSRPDTLDHIYNVSKTLEFFYSLLARRGIWHDDSKLRSPEKEIFDIYTPKLKGTTYGSDEYKQYLKEMQVALDHHYKVNRHHPEHFGEKGIKGMNLVDLVEMFCDWYAATKRHADGDIRKSIKFNQGRFGYSEDLEQILQNTVELLEEKYNVSTSQTQ